VLGSPHGGAAELAAFRHGWYAIVAAGLAAALAAITLRRGTRAPAVATVPAAAAAAGSAPASSAPASSAPASSGSPSSAPASSAAAD